MTPTIEPVGPDDAATVLAVVRAAFAARPPLDPPADATAETEASLAARLAPCGGLLARVAGEPVGALVLDPAGPTTYLRRFGVLPGARGHGVAARLVEAAVAAAGPGTTELAVVAREELPDTIDFWRRRGFVEVSRTPPTVELRRPLRPSPRAEPEGPAGAEVPTTEVPTTEVPTAEAMHALGRDLAGRLRAGDLVVLSGGLGAGKTTLTQGLAAGLGVRGPVTSPTFVIARVHPSEVGGPDLVHVDAYRLGGLAELDDLDLDASLDDAVTVVEWGEGLAETLADSRLEVRIERAVGGAGGSESRRVTVSAHGPRWAP